MLPNENFVQIEGERYYAIPDVDRMPPFFMSLVSSSDLWMFLSSTGGLTAGRVQPEQAIFPYRPVDMIHLSANETGSRSLIRVRTDKGLMAWEPFNVEQDGRYEVRRSLYKNELGTKVIFEEENATLGLKFAYSWSAAGDMGFVREAWLESLGGAVSIELLDGLQNILPAGTPRTLQSTSSALVDAYKWNELDPETRVASYSLYARISDRAEPSESLDATTVFSLGLDEVRISLDVADFLRVRRGLDVSDATVKRGVRGAYFLRASFRLSAGERRSWQIVANIPQSQAQVVVLRRELRSPERVVERLRQALEENRYGLRDLLARADGFQCVRNECFSAHHTANVLFNVMRGGVFPDQYWIEREDFTTNLHHRNLTVFSAHEAWLASLPARLSLVELAEGIQARGDAQLHRLLMEYLPLVFSRRHGDPSRPWNHFVIQLKDSLGKRRLAYQGNWRDIFQNWESLLLSYPAFAPHVIAKFLNASTLDGYNPYRISQDGIDWEIHDPEDPWSNIGYWGDHQINYLLRLLELSQRHAPSLLREMLGKPLFCYSNVPYRIASFESLLADSKDTVSFDEDEAQRIKARCERLGSDGRLVVDAQGQVLLVGLAEKLFVTLMAKLGNLVPRGGIWMNTQRPEWNDANNALVGSGLSMVTLCYMRRYVAFLQELLAADEGRYSFGAELADWIEATTATLKKAGEAIASQKWTPAEQYSLFRELGETASQFRESIYRTRCPAGTRELDARALRAMLDAALVVLDDSIRANRCEDGLYHAYNLLLDCHGKLKIGHLYPMLEGQVAVLSSGLLDARESADLLEALFASAMYREDQKSFTLYPDASGVSFLEKNRVPAERLQKIAVLREMIDRGDTRVVLKDVEGCYRFAPSFDNVKAMRPVLAKLRAEYSGLDSAVCQEVEDLYEEVFHHKRFTGRSGTMFAFEGLGSIYWHMVSKLLLASQEVFFSAHTQSEDPETVERLGRLYYRIREGLGFNKRASEYGAFPCDPYSHTPGHAGAQQPGMTGQVKEEIITRQGELGLIVMDGCIFFNPALLASSEFLDSAAVLDYLDVDDQWQRLDLSAGELCFTSYQVPFRLSRVTGLREAQITLVGPEGRQRKLEGAMIPNEEAQGLFLHDGHIREVRIEVPEEACFGGYLREAK